MFLSNLLRLCRGLGARLVAIAICGFLFEQSSCSPVVYARDFEEPETEFYEKIDSLRWIAYSPSTFDPSAGPGVKRKDVEADLRAIKAAGFNAIVTYSSAPLAKPGKLRKKRPTTEIGMDGIARVARNLEFEGFVAGIWDINSAPEIDAVNQLAKDTLIDAVCVGNEGLDVRYTWNDLAKVMRAVRASTSLPVTTAEQIEDYGNDNLRGEADVDWLFPNIHPVFHNIREPAEAAKWSVSMALALKGLAKDDNAEHPLPVLVKETGWPSRGLSFHSESSQKEFWQALEERAREAKVSFVTFEAFDQRWKKEPWMGADIGGAWGVFSANRVPKLVVSKGANLPEDEIGERVYVYLNAKGPRAFIPAGWMPDGLGISQNESEKTAPHTKPHCVRYHCQLSEKPWLGIYFLLDGKWEPERQFDLIEELNAQPDDSIRCRFWARSKDGAAVQFKVGGVQNGAIRDSVTFPVATEYLKLTSDWKRYEIDLTGRNLSSLVGAFVWVTDRVHNSTADISFDLDTIYFVKVKPASESP